MVGMKNQNKPGNTLCIRMYGEKKKVLFSRKYKSYESKDHEILTIYNVSFFYIYS